MKFWLGPRALKRLSVIFIAIVSIAAVSACRSAKGSSGMGDPIHPELGNGGYDVEHYDIVISIDPLANSILAAVTIRATTTQNLNSFNLDFADLSVDSLQVNGSPASYSQQDNEMIVTPSETIPDGEPFTVYIEYHGNPEPMISPILDEPVGWFHLADGTINVINWPDGTGSWLPGNHHPSDKATFRFDITVPEPWIVVAPGEDRGVRLVDGEAQYIFDMEVPMSSVSAVINIDNYQVSETTGPAGVLIRSYVPRDVADQVSYPSEDLVPFIEYLIGLFGEYPFDQYSMVILDPGLPFCQSGIADGEQTVSMHCPSWEATSSATIAHEITHQWFGISVGPYMFQDSWLAEGPATYVEWLWQSREGSEEQLDWLARGIRSGYYGSTPISSPSADTLLSVPTYWGGALLLHALRQEVGDDVFFDILRAYLDRNQYSSASTSDFRNIAEEISGHDLKLFFDSWLLEAKIPPVQSSEETNTTPDP